MHLILILGSEETIAEVCDILIYVEDVTHPRILVDLDNLESGYAIVANLHLLWDALQNLFPAPVFN